jgi:hypothetical protein
MNIDLLLSSFVFKRELSTQKFEISSPPIQIPIQNGKNANFVKPILSTLASGNKTTYSEF